LTDPCALKAADSLLTVRLRAKFALSIVKGCHMRHQDMDVQMAVREASSRGETACYASPNDVRTV